MSVINNNSLGGTSIASQPPVESATLTELLNIFKTFNTNKIMPKIYY